MKARLPKALFVIFLSFIVFPLFGQKGIEDGSKYGHGQDSVNCRRNASLYKTYYDQGNIPMALGFWRKAFYECPGSSSNMHLHGINMYKKLYTQTRDMAYIDTIDIIYQARIRYFSTAKRPEAYYLGRQGLDIYQFARRGDNPELLQKAFDVLGKSIELDPRRAHPNNLQTFMGVTQMMFENEMLGNEDVINNYGMLMDILDERIAARNGAEDKTAKETIDLIFKSGGAATCEGLIPLFTQRVQDNPNDLELLKKVINLLNDAGCNDSDLYYTAAESLYQQEKSATAAYHLAEMNADKMDYDKAEEYYKEAISMEEDQKNIANYYIKMATFRLSNKDYQIARDYAKEAIKADPDNGTAYMLVGNAYSAVQIFDDDIQNQMIFWVAADYFRTAKQKDPELAERCDGYISSVAQYFPKKEDLFFISIIEEGVEHKVGGWINETTTVRFRQEN